MKNIINKLDNNKKIILVKTSIAIAGILLVLVSIIGLTFKFKYNDDESYTLVYSLYISSYLAFLSAGLFMLYLMWNIDIRDVKVKPLRYNTKFKDYKKLKQHVQNKITEKEYNYFKSFDYGNYKIEYSIKNTYKSSKIFCLINCEEMTEQMLNDFTTNYFEKFGNFIIENGEVKVTNDITITFIICVERINNNFTKYVTSNVKQYFGKFNLPIGISFGSNQLYLPPQEGGVYKNIHKKLSKEILKLLEIESTKK